MTSLRLLWRSGDRFECNPTPRFLLIAVALGVAISCPISGDAMDWDTSALVAWCPNRVGFEQDAKRTQYILQKHKIVTLIMYYAKMEGGSGLTEDIKHSTGWMLAVNVKNADAARKLIAEAVKKGLRINLLPEGSGPP